MDRQAAEKALIHLARQSAVTSKGVRGKAFAGNVLLETDNTLYRFIDGVFSARASRTRGASNTPPAWESPPAMAGLELIGFLAAEDGLWSLSATHRPGALAVMRRYNSSSADRPFTLTSPTNACTITPSPFTPAPEADDSEDVPLDDLEISVVSSAPPISAAPASRRFPRRSEVASVRRPPAPASLTRLQPAPPSTSSSPQ
jgi:hypothetical protein